MGGGKMEKNTTSLKLNKAEEDMVELFNKFKIPKLKYVDVSQQERLKKIMAHWPLLDELKAKP